MSNTNDRFIHFKLEKSKKKWAKERYDNVMSGRVRAASEE